MTKIRAFRAIRPAKNKAHLVASREISSYSQKDLNEKLRANPYTFIHIIYPELTEDDSNRTAPNSKERFLKVKNRYINFLNNQILIQEKNESLYVYRQSIGTHSYLGIIGGASIKEYQSGKIKKHEATLTSREEMFTNYLDTVGFNAEPVLLSHKKSPDLDKILQEITKEAPEYDFTTTDKKTHELWVVKDQNIERIQAAFKKIECCYIADGHHRSASSSRYQNLLKTRKGYSPEKNYNYFLSFFIDEERLNILPFHRLCKTLNGHTKESLLKALKEHFLVSPLTTAHLPKQAHNIVMYLEGQWYNLNIQEDNFIQKSPVNSIDAEILSHYVLSPILGIHDLKTDENIHFISKENGIDSIKQFIDSGVYKVGFLLYPTSVEQVKAVADANEIMPPKSTWVEPKLRSGLTIYNLDE